MREQRAPSLIHRPLIMQTCVPKEAVATLETATLSLFLHFFFKFHSFVEFFSFSLNSDNIRQVESRTIKVNEKFKDRMFFI